MESLDLAADLAVRLAGAHDRDVDTVVVEALERLARAAGADRSYITLYDDDGTFENTHEWTATGIVPQMPVIKQLPIRTFAHTHDLVLRHEVFAAPDLMALPPTFDTEKASFASFGVKAVLQVPIVVSDEGVGLIGFNHFDVVEPWPEELISLVTRVGQVIGVVLMRQRAIEQTRRAYDEAALAMRERDELLTHVSHELRTPLHAILGYAELLELDGASGRDREALLQIQLNGRRLLTMVEDLLTLASSGDRRQEIGLQSLVTQVVDDLEDASGARGVGIGVSNDLDGVAVHTEPGRARQVLYCVLSSAVQSVGHGGTVVVGRPSAGNGTIQVRVDSPNGAPSVDDVVTPLARFLIDGHGAISATNGDTAALDVSLTFAQPDRP